jgi:HEAT repeat protein
MRKQTAASIAERISPDNFTQATQEELGRTRSKIEPQLIKLLRHREPFVREIAATLLGERRRPQSIPALIRAVSDRSEHVAFDAIIAIEKCAGLGVGELVATLFLDLSKPRAAAGRLASWWRIVRGEVLR